MNRFEKKSADELMKEFYRDQGITTALLTLLFVLSWFIFDAGGFFY